MFDEVTRRGRARRARRIAAFVVGAAAVQAVIIAAAVLLHPKLQRPPAAPAVDVIFARRSGLGADPRAPGAPRAALVSSRSPGPARAPPARPGAAAHDMPAVTDRPPLVESGPSRSPALDRGVDEGAGADRGSGSGGVRAVASAGAFPVSGIDDAPRDAGAGFSTPSEMKPGCVRSAIRLPRDLAGFVSGPISVKFAVGRDGAAALVQVVTPVPDPRIADAIRAAVTGCAWKPGADAQGRPVRLWVVLPVRFTTG